MLWWADKSNLHQPNEIIITPWYTQWYIFISIYVLVQQTNMFPASSDDWESLLVTRTGQSMMKESQTSSSTATAYLSFQNRDWSKATHYNVAGSYILNCRISIHFLARGAWQSLRPPNYAHPVYSHTVFRTLNCLISCAAKSLQIVLFTKTTLFQIIIAQKIQKYYPIIFGGHNKAVIIITIEHAIKALKPVFMK